MKIDVDEFPEAIDASTQFCDVRDLHAMWRESSHRDLPTLDDLSTILQGPLAERLVTLNLVDGYFRYRSVGRQVIALFGHNPTGRRHDTLDSPSAEAFSPIYHRVRETGIPSFAVQNRVGYGTIGATERLILPLRDGNDRLLMVYIRPRNETSELMRAVFHVSADAITVLEAVKDGNGSIIDFSVIAANVEAARRLQRQPNAVIGLTLRETWPMAEADGVFARMVQSVDRQQPDVFDTFAPCHGQSVECQLRLAPHGSGLTVTNVDLTPILSAGRAIETQRNELMTMNGLLEQRARDLMVSYQSLERSTQELRDEIDRNRALESELVHLAHHDSLTGLPNRGYFEECFEQTLQEARGKRRRVALCIIDLDHFKDINDSLGHNAGDAVLQEVATRISSVVRKSDLVGRLGGDEFAVLLTDALDIDNAASAVERMIEAITRSFKFNRVDVPIDVSVGIAVSPHDGDTTVELMANADIALYRAKRGGRSHSIFFTAEMRKETDRRFRLLNRLRLAIDAGDVVPFYQPFADLTTGRIVGFEALARWLHVERGVLTPAIFADALEEADIAQALTRHMIRQIIADVVEWKRAGMSVRININVTAFDLRKPSFAADLHALILANGLQSSQIVVEVTETTILSRDTDRIKITLEELHQFGFSIALDDFGTGYGSLSHLRTLPVDILKIDRSFVTDLNRDAKTTAIVRSIVALAAPLDLTIVAEGVETPAQCDAARSLGCHIGQGYLFSPAMPAAAVLAFSAAFGLTDRVPRESAA